MTSANRRLVRSILPCLLVLLGAAVVAQDDARPAGKEKARITLTMLGTRRGGTTNPMMVLGPVDLAEGDKRPPMAPPAVFAADTEATGPQGCGAQMTFTPVEAVLDRFPLVWTVSVHVRSIQTDQIVLDVAWERLTRDDKGTRRLAGSATPEAITLREGERTLLDFAAGAPGADSGCDRNFALELTAGLAEDSALARRQIEYDLGLVHEAPGGRRASRHLEVTGSQGDKSAFQFPHQRLPGPEADLQVDVKGTLRGRVRTDGSVELSLGTDRQLWYVSADGSGETVSDGGRKLLSLHPRETIRVDLPGATRNTQQPDRYARDLAGHSFALVLQARPLDPR